MMEKDDDGFKKCTKDFGQVFDMSQIESLLDGNEDAVCNVLDSQCFKKNYFSFCFCCLEFGSDIF